MELAKFTDSIEVIIEKHIKYLRNLKENLANEIDVMNDVELYSCEQKIRLQAEMVQDLKAILKNAKNIGTSEEVVDIAHAKERVDYMSHIRNIDTFLIGANMTEDEFFGRTEINRDIVIIDNNFPKNCKAIINGNLTISVHKIEDNFQPIVSGFINCTCSEIGENFQPSSLGDIILKNVKKLPKGFECNTGESLFLQHVTEYEGTFKSNVGKSLSFGSLKDFPTPFEPNVFEDISLEAINDLEVLRNCHNNFRPSVGEEIYLSHDYHEDNGYVGMFNVLFLKTIERPSGIRCENGIIMRFEPRSNEIHKVFGKNVNKLIMKKNLN